MRNHEKPPEYDEVYRLVSTFGRYQKVVVFSVGFLASLIAFQFSILVFGFGTPNFSCTTPANVTCEINKCCDNCTGYAFAGPFKSVVSEWNLICDRSYLRALVQSMFFAGMLVGSFVSGPVSDIYGRKCCSFVFTATLILGAAVSVVVDCVSFLCFLRFVVGVGCSGIFTGTFTLVLEFVGPNRRTMIGCVYQYYWAFGFMSFVLTAYFIRDWRPMVLLTSLPALSLFLFIKVFPESPRWLMAQGRVDEAHAILMKFKDEDNKSVDSERLKELLVRVWEGERNAENREPIKKFYFLDLVRTPKIRKRSLIMAYTWFSQSFLSNAFFLYVDNLVGNIYLNFAIMQGLNPVLIGVQWMLAKNVGRRVTHAGTFLVCGALCLLSLSVPEDQPLGRTGIFVTATVVCSVLWVTAPLMGTELFPTVLRATALGTGYTIGRIGATLSPYVGMLAQLPGSSVILPLTIFGVVSMVAGILTLLLPETLRQPMHQTIEEEEAADEDYGIPCMRRPLSRETVGVDKVIENKDLTTAL